MTAKFNVVDSICKLYGNMTDRFGGVDFFFKILV